MAVANVVATTIAEQSRLLPWKVAGDAAQPVLSKSGHCAVAAANDDGSTYRLLRLPSNARLLSLRVFCSAITSGTSYDFGLYDAGSTVKDADCYASAVDLSSALNGVEIAFEARALTAHRQRVWEDAGDSADPGTDYDVVATANTVGSANGTIMCVAEYVLT